MQGVDGDGSVDGGTIRPRLCIRFRDGGPAHPLALVSRPRRNLAVPGGAARIGAACAFRRFFDRRLAVDLSAQSGGDDHALPSSRSLAPIAGSVVWVAIVLDIR